MGGIVDGRLTDLTGEQVEQASLGYELLPVVDELQAAVQAGVGPQPLLDVLGDKRVVFEHLQIGDELDVGSVGLSRLPAFLLPLEPAALENRLEVLAVAVGDDPELRGKGVDGLRAHAIETDAELEHVVVVLRTGVDHGYAVDDLAQRDSPTVVADADGRAIDGDVDLLAVSHDVFVDPVVYGLLEQDVDAIVGVGPVAKPADVHTWPEADVLQ